MVSNTYGKLREIWLEKLKNSGNENAEFEINELLGLALGMDCRSPLFVEKLKCEAEQEVRKNLENFCGRRLNGEPLQYIIGEWEFYGLPFKVGKGVLIPRQDTETLVDIALKKFNKCTDITVTDLCSGSGCIAVALEKNLSCKRVCCVEKSDMAIGYLRQNIKLNQSDAEVFHGDIFDKKIIETLPQSDLIVCNPPYITAEEMKFLQQEVTFEPECALLGGEDGLDYYREITRIYKSKINEGGFLMFEIGQGQEDEVMRIMIQHGFKNVRARTDMCGIIRCVFGQKLTSTKLCTDVMKV